MIKNERQYRITKSEAEKFQRALAAWDPHTPAGVDPAIHASQKAALESQLRDLRHDLHQYEGLQSGRQAVLEVDSFEEFPSALVKARIAVGLSQKELADRLGLKEQQIQRYEASDYSGASLARMMEVVRALGIKVRKEVFLPTTPNSLDTLLRRLQGIGFDRHFVEHRLVSKRLRLRNGGPTSEDDGFVFHVATSASRVLGVPPATLLGADLRFDSQMVLGATRFKVQAGANRLRLDAYTVYAHYLALLMLEATTHLPIKQVPTDALTIRKGILESYGVLDLASALRFIWDHGIPVLPLNDPGAFHGACWRTGGRNVIALKQRTNSLARWLHDSIHEFGHAGQNPDLQEFAILEEDEAAAIQSRSQEEMVVNQLAGDVMLGGRAEELAQMCVKAASGNLVRLKSAVSRVAAREGVPLDILANYMAYRLAFQGENWWGVATNLQSQSGKSWLVARDIALERIDFSQLNPIDRELLTLALNDPED